MVDSVGGSKGTDDVLDPDVVVNENDEFAYLGTKTGDVLKVSLEGNRLFKRKSDYKQVVG